MTGTGGAMAQRMGLITKEGAGAILTLTVMPTSCYDRLLTLSGYYTLFNVSKTVNVGKATSVYHDHVWTNPRKSSFVLAALDRWNIQRGKYVWRKSRKTHAMRS
jgi:hypothetical protein